MTNSDAELSSQIVLRLKAHRQNGSDIYELIRKNTTKSNLNQMLAFLTELTGGRIQPEIVLTDPLYREDSYEDEYRISVLYAASDPGLIIRIVRRAYPYSVPINNARIPESWDGCRMIDIVSKAKFLCAVKGQKSSVEEDNIESDESYLAYCLRNDIPGTRGTYLAPRHVISDDWGAIAHHYCYELSDPNDLEDELMAAYEAWYTEYRRSLWCNLQGRLLNLSIALAPLRQVPYTLLWILDLIRPMSFRYWKDGQPYDPNHLRKLRLFERVATSYEMMSPGGGLRCPPDTMIMTSRAASTDAGAR